MTSKTDGRWSFVGAPGRPLWTPSSSTPTASDTRRSRTRGERRLKVRSGSEGVVGVLSRQLLDIICDTRFDALFSRIADVRASRRTFKKVGYVENFFESIFYKRLGASLVVVVVPASLVRALVVVVVFFLADVDGARQLGLGGLVQELVTVRLGVEALRDAVFDRQAVADILLVLALHAGVPDLPDELPGVRFRGRDPRVVDREPRVVDVHGVRLHGLRHLLRVRDEL
mmetsp:Transcript_16116/g.67814  ORF Transcript_16116/g.67814 Transcript_16116/m.67814 type:complete len:228 (-) Transcript_16116:654-1337(-)